MSNTIQEKENVAQKPIVYVIGFTAALAGLLFGLDVGVIAGALPFIAKDFGAGTVTQEEIVSALLLGATFGAVISGFLSKLSGRKNPLLVAAVVFALGSLQIAKSDFLSAT